MMKIFIPWMLLACIIITCAHADLKNMRPIYEWRYIDYDFPSEEARQQAIASGKYTPTEGLAVDFDKDRETDRAFITVAGLNATVKVFASVCTITNKTSAAGPLLRAYPSLEWYDESRDCNDRIAGALRIMVDKCNHLWILDVGIRTIPMIRLCPPKILVFDLKTDTLIRSIRIPNRVASKPGNDIGVTEKFDVSVFGEKCESAIVYMADFVHQNLIVYSRLGSKETFHRLHISAFRDNINHSNITVANDTISLEGSGIYSLALANSRLFIHPLNSVDLIETKEIDVLLAHYPHHPLKYTLYPNIISHPITSMVADEEHEIILFGLTKETAIGVWNYRQKNKIEIIEQDLKTMQFMFTLKVLKSKTGEKEVFALSSGAQRFFTQKLNPTQVNYRILAGPLTKLLEGTKAGAPSLCDKLSGDDKVKQVSGSEDARVEYNPEDLLEEDNITLISDEEND